MNQLKENLVQRLAGKGIPSSMLPGFFRSLANSALFRPQMNLYQVNKRLNYLGWTGVELDYHTYQLAIDCLEKAGLKKLEYRPPKWFEKLLIFDE